MDVTSIAATATAMTTLNQTNQVQLSVLKKAMQIEQQGAMALIAALPQPVQSANLPDHLGQNVNTTA
ncbi:putative motility protein [Oryzomicrobium sp.]|uniref:putative motility protein n=1 Tax=Oryzomicrobium sp. TaxID=1911578 RepID=UPI0025F11A24|nr:putative motility protein [Oryzomicrobium sp.]MCE1242311.1 YjfB family protein [Oryzomicrobium sp.]